jgi:hypothetical protein
MIRVPQFLFAMLILVSLFSSIVSAQDNLIGSWNVTAETPEGDNDSVWTFTGSDGEISGSSVSGETGETSSFKDVKLDGDSVSFAIDIEAQGIELMLFIEAKLSDASLEGEWNALDLDGNNLASGTLAGDKVKQQQKKQVTKKDLFAGQWDSVAVLPDGNKSESLFSLTREDGKLTGFLDGDNGKTDFTSVEVSGKTILFAFTLEVQGVERDLEIEAELQGDGSLSGEWIVMQDGAEAATGDWSATRKVATEILFDGKSLDNFRGYKQEKIGEGWKVVDGILVFEGSGGDIITKKEYENFELSFEWMISEGGNSGVMYRVKLGDSAPYKTGVEYQILDNDKHADGKNRTTSAGSLYALYAPGDEQPKAVGKWNTSKIVTNGDKVEHWLNGVKVVEAEFGSDDWNKKVAESKFATWKKFAKSKKGHIAFQDHHDKVSYRNITIKSMD